MKKLSFLLIALVTVLGWTQCKPYLAEGQGITGQITWIEGNQMPTRTLSGEPSKTNPNGTPIKRIVRVYTLINIEDVSIENGLIRNLAASPITEIESDQDGKYSLKLSPGRYSVFTVEEGGLFANIFDGQGNVQPVTVKEGQWTKLDIVINHKAVF
jgi:hypothetical protein